MPNKLKVKKGDQVKVISGKDKGKTGAVLRVLPKEGKVLVEGVAIAKRSIRGRTGQVGRILERPRPIDASNVQVISTKPRSVLDAPAKGGSASGGK